MNKPANKSLLEMMPNSVKPFTNQKSVKKGSKVIVDEQETAVLDIASLPHYAEAETTLNPTASDAVVDSSTTVAVATAPIETVPAVSTGISGWAWAGGALAAIGIGAAAGGGGGGGSSTATDTTAPAKATMNVVAGNDTVTSTEKTAGVVVAGTAEAGSTVTVVWGATTKTAVATNGTYTVTFSSSEIPTDSTVNITATARDTSNNTSVVATHSVTINTVTSNGIVADGYVKGAAIWIDTTGDGVEDYNTGVITDALGNFSLDADVLHGTIIAIGGTNVDTDIANTMKLKAPEGSTVVNPLTTLVQAVLASSASGTSVATATASVVAALGLTTGTDLTTYDPIAHSDANALNAQQAAASVATIITLASNSASNTTTATATTNTVISNIVTEIANSKTSNIAINLADSM